LVLLLCGGESHAAVIFRINGTIGDVPLFFENQHPGIIAVAPNCKFALIEGHQKCGDYVRPAPGSLQLQELVHALAHGHAAG
jgi:hypothetical protein